MRNCAERIVSGTSEQAEIKSPRETMTLFGHADAESALLQAYKTNRMPHAWLIGGSPGIGKATLAFRLARFVLAHPDPRAAAVQQATSLAVDEDNPVTRRMATHAQADLLVLERITNEQTGKLYTTIRVEDVRRSVSFFGSTAGEGGWRIVIVDAVDDLQREGANALLKILEEPPARALLLLISHSPGRELPTIRSRCRRLLLRPLEETDVIRAATMAAGRNVNDAALIDAASAAGGSVARALQLLDGTALSLRHRILELIGQLPNPDSQALHALGDALSGTDPKALATFLDSINEWFSMRLMGDAEELNQRKHTLARLADIWEQINRNARDVEAYNLERKPFVFSVFGALADMARN